jgi:arginase
MLIMVPFIGLASGIGGSDEGSHAGPIAIYNQLPLKGVWKAMIHPEKTSLNKEDHISLLNQKLAQVTYDCASSHPFTVVIGGDHSCAIGTWSGIAEAKRVEGEDIGVLWFDAHMDSHTMETSETGNIHGMPLATLMGYGSPKLTQILSSQPKLKPENVFLIGIRSFEEPERILLERLNVRVYYMEEVRQRGLKAVILEILDNLSSRGIKYGLSLDIDFFDPKRMTATGTPSEGGPEPEEFIQNYSLFNAYPPIAFEFVEFNPARDTNHESLKVIHQILQLVLESHANSHQALSSV